MQLSFEATNSTSTLTDLLSNILGLYISLGVSQITI